MTDDEIIEATADALWRLEIAEAGLQTRPGVTVADTHGAEQYRADARAAFRVIAPAVLRRAAGMAEEHIQEAETREWSAEDALYDLDGALRLCADVIEQND